MEERSYFGCLPSKVDVRDYRLCAANVLVEYPEEFLLDNLPKVKDLKNINSCCAHATSSILEYHADNKFDLSTNFIYGILRLECGHTGPGMYLTDALKISNKYGDMLEKDCAGNTEIPSCWSEAELSLKDSKKADNAYKFRICSYYSCEREEDIKFALMNYGPVLAAIMWREKYILDSNNVIYFDPYSNGGGHAVCVIGWNKYGWIILNSWGEDFGKSGRFVLPFTIRFLEARAVVDEENDNELNDLVLLKPSRGPIFDLLYKVCNWAINIFK